MHHGVVIEPRGRSWDAAQDGVVALKDRATSPVRPVEPVPYYDETLVNPYGSDDSDTEPEEFIIDGFIYDSKGMQGLGWTGGPGGNVGWVRDLTREGIHPNPGPGDMKDKVCNGCGKKGHIKSNCRQAKGGNANKRGKKGGVTEAMREAQKDYDARTMADADLVREMAKVVAEEKQVPIPRFNFKKTFENRECSSVNTPGWIYVVVVWKFFLPIVMALFAFDVLFFPLVCVWLGDTIRVLTNPVFAGISFYVIWMGENFVLGGVCYAVSQIMKAVRFSAIARRRIHLHGSADCNRDVAIYDFGPDLRPKDMSHGKRLNMMDIHRVEEEEFFILQWKKLGVELEYGQARVDHYRICGSAFAHLAPTITSRGSKIETSDSMRRLLAKFGSVNWNPEDMIEHNLIENTARVLDRWKVYVDETEDRKYGIEDKFNYQHCDNFSEFWPAWLRGMKNKLMFFAFLLCVVMCLSTWYHWISCAVLFGFNGAVKCHGFFWTVGTWIFGLFGPLAFPVAGASILQEAAAPASDVAFAKPPGAVLGYRVSDHFCDGMANNDIDPEKKLEITFMPNKSLDRQPMAVFTPFAIDGMAMPMVDRDDPLTTAAGLAHRGGGFTPKPLPRWLDAKRNISNEVCGAYFPVLNDSDLLTFDQVLDKTHYTLDRKEQLRSFHKNRTRDFDEYTSKRETAMFNKSEPYAKAKHARSIQGQHDRVWMSDILGSVGRLIKTIETFVYTIPPCTKKMDTAALGVKLFNLGPGSKTVSDYKSYEASFKSYVKESAQFPLYDHMTQGLSQSGQWQHMYRWLLNGRNQITNKHLKALISNIKCSGDFDTALSNWWDNVISWLTAYQLVHGVHWSEALYWFFCEGDDNITDDHGYEFREEHFANMGLKAVIETNLTLGEAGYCQQFVNVETGNLVGDVIRFLGKRQYFDVKYNGAKKSTCLSLSRAVAMSVMSTYPNAPGIAEWAWAILRMTEGVIVKKKHLAEAQGWGKEKVYDNTTNFSEPVISQSDRLMVSYVFDFSLRQQSELTEALSEWEGGNLSLPLEWFPEQWCVFYTRYSARSKVLWSGIEHSDDAEAVCTDWLRSVVIDT